MGWIKDGESLVHAPFAWMIQQLHSYLGIRFDEAKLTARFPSFGRASTNDSTSATESANNPCGGVSLGQAATKNVSTFEAFSEPEQIPGWCRGRISYAGAAMLALVGKKARQPGQILPDPGPCPATRNGQSVTGLVEAEQLHESRHGNNSRPQVQIHIGARLRTAIDELDAVPGYVLVAPVTGSPYWARRGRSGLHSLRESTMTGGGSVCHSGTGAANVKILSTNRIKAPRQEDEVGMNAGCLRGQSMSSRSREVEGCGILDWIGEARVGALEAALLGLPPQVVSDGF